MSRPIARTLLDRVTRECAGPIVGDTEGFTAVSVQIVYTGKRVAVELKGRMLGGAETVIKAFDSLTLKSGRVLPFGPGYADPWFVGIEEIWAVVTAIDSGEVSLYFCGRD
jgi:hypothetical protein